MLYQYEIKNRIIIPEYKSYQSKKKHTYKSLLSISRTSKLEYPLAALRVKITDMYIFSGRGVYMKYV